MEIPLNRWLATKRFTAVWRSQSSVRGSKTICADRKGGLPVFILLKNARGVQLLKSAAMPAQDEAADGGLIQTGPLKFERDHAYLAAI
jgi:hypothetical protein